MGSLSSRPSMPKTNTVYVSQPVASAGFTVDAQEAVSEKKQDVSQNEKDSAQSKQRVQNILRNRRGRGSTILSSFRGVLEPSQKTLERKTLLGE